jgi:histidyl-tRNA synthetase
MGDVLDYAVSCATTLRGAGVRTQVYTEQKKVKAKFSYADKLGIPYAVIIGGDEAANGTVSLKNLTTGDQVTLSAEAAAAEILKNINRPVKPVKGS